MLGDLKYSLRFFSHRAVGLFVAVVALIASSPTARLAMNVDPIAALCAE
jgi:hypothetical protein